MSPEQIAQRIIIYGESAERTCGEWVKYWAPVSVVGSAPNFSTEKWICTDTDTWEMTDGTYMTHDRGTWYLMRRILL